MKSLYDNVCLWITAGSCPLFYTIFFFYKNTFKLVTNEFLSLVKRDYYWPGMPGYPRHFY